MRRLKKHEYVLLGIFALVAVFPLATSSDGWSFISTPLASLTSPHDALRMREEQMAERRMHVEIRRLCSKRAGTDETVECPDINDPLQVRRFMEGKPIRLPVESGAILESQSGAVRALRIIDLSDGQQSMLRRFVRVGRCPYSLNAILPGFGDLCLSEIGTSPTILQDLVQERVRLREARDEEAGPTLDMIIDMFKGARPDR